MYLDYPYARVTGFEQPPTATGTVTGRSTTTQNHYHSGLQSNLTPTSTTTIFTDLSGSNSTGSVSQTPQWPSTSQLQWATQTTSPNNDPQLAFASQSQWQAAAVPYETAVAPLHYEPGYTPGQARLNNFQFGQNTMTQNLTVAPINAAELPTSMANLQNTLAQPSQQNTTLSQGLGPLGLERYMPWIPERSPSDSRVAAETTSQSITRPFTVAVTTGVAQHQNLNSQYEDHADAAFPIATFEYDSSELDLLMSAFETDPDSAWDILLLQQELMDVNTDINTIAVAPAQPSSVQPNGVRPLEDLSMSEHSASSLLVRSF